MPDVPTRSEDRGEWPPPARPVLASVLSAPVTSHERRDAEVRWEKAGREALTAGAGGWGIIGGSCDLLGVRTAVVTTASYRVVD